MRPVAHRAAASHKGKSHMPGKDAARRHEYVHVPANLYAAEDRDAPEQTKHKFDQLLVVHYARLAGRWPAIEIRTGESPAVACSNLPIA